MIPCNSDTRESYVWRHSEKHLEVARLHHALGHERSMWIQLLTWAMADDIYGTHWDKLQEKK
jgi:hypothetical protein